MKNDEIKVDRIVDVIGEICPVPLMKTRKALHTSKRGEIFEIIGTHGESKKEIQLAVKSSGNRILKQFEEEDIWHIIIEKVCK
ncbi:sulfurtransferase TusA family protein [candidate division WOR-3 bacterium]|nr:sulfurtransferase TusA family protein [candidate division WOR-3 bacterium]